MIPTLKGWQNIWHPSRVRSTDTLLSGGLRYATTTGYYLAAFQAEIPSLRFHTLSVEPDAKGYFTYEQ